MATIKSKNVEVSIEKITPSKAKSILEHQNPGNRGLRKTVVERYARDIKAGRWHMAGDPIRFNGDGTLIDGQHRLAGVVESKTAIKAVVIRGISSDAKYHIDMGAKRSFADVLHYMGYVDRNQLAATIRWICMYDGDMLNSRKSPTTAEMLDWLSVNEDVVDSVGFVTRKTPFPTLKTVMTGIHFITRDSLPGESEAFFTTLRDGVGLEKGQPVHTLRTWLERVQASTKKPNPLIIQALVVKAWNAYIEGRPLWNLRFTPGGMINEKFPKITTQYSVEENE